MNTRERFVRTLIGEKVDRVPFMKIFGGTNAIHPEWEEEYPGIGECIDELLGFEGTYRGWATTPVNMDPSGMGVPEILKEDERIVVQRRGDGTVDQIHKSGNYNRHTIEWPIKRRDDWEAYKEKYLDPDDPTRFPENWDELVREYKDRDYPLQLTHRGVYGFAREKMGDENLAFAFYDDPGLVHDMMDYYTDMAIAVWEKQTKDVEFDLIECWEDMASKNGALISPKMFRDFMTPCYEKIAAFAKEHGIKIILVDSDGLIEELTGLMLEGGVTALYPYEVIAGNDVAMVLDRYPDIGVIGGLRKEAMYEGKNAIDREMEKACELIKKGRYIPGPDHFVLKVASFANYRYFMERLREVVMTTKPEI
jgi:uroporphyrinogen decarboxylase